MLESRRRTISYLALGGSGALLLLNALSYWLIVDDAFIAFRYADNLAAGLGPVFNPGERVEGYTDFLWVALLAVTRLLGLATPAAAQVLGAACSLLTLLVLWKAGRRLFGLDSVSATFPGFALAGSASVAMWTGGGLETPLFMLLFTLALAQTLRELCDPGEGLPRGGLLFGLAALTRPEAAGLFLVTLLAAWLLRLGRPRLLLKLAAGFALLVVPHLIFRLVYYGAPLPNTVYAKTSASSAMFLDGIGYLGKFLLTHGIWALAALAGLWLGASPSQRRLVLLVALVLGAAATAVVAVGGDIYPYGRFCVPYLPWLVLLVCVGAHRWGTRLSPRAGPATALAVALAVAIPAKLWPDAQDRPALRQLATSAPLMRLYGEWLGTHHPGAWLAISSLGRVPYYSGLPTIDMLGLADTHIARRKMELTRGILGHQRYDSEYVLSRRPTIIGLETYTLGPFDPAVDLYTEKLYQRTRVSQGFWPAVEDLLGRRDFRLDYEPRMAEVAPGTLFFYFKRDTSLREQLRRTSTSLDPSVHFRLALALRQHGLHDDAIAELRRVLSLDPQARGAAINIGFFLHEAGRHQAALTEFRLLQERWPAEPQIFYGLALSLHKLARFREAAEAWRRYLEVDPAGRFAPRARRLLLEATRRTR